MRSYESSPVVIHLMYSLSKRQEIVMLVNEMTVLHFMIGEWGGAQMMMVLYASVSAVSILNNCMSNVTPKTDLIYFGR